jgi:two-component system, response regulator PdtaR
MRILVVEDDPMISFMIEDALAEDGHEVVGSAVTSGEARRLVERTLPDLMLVDVHLVDGETGCTFAREAHEKWHVPTIFVTGSPEKARQCDDAIGVLTKPFQADSVAGAVAVAASVRAGRVPTRLPVEMQLFAGGVG